MTAARESQTLDETTGLRRERAATLFEQGTTLCLTGERSDDLGAAQLDKVPHAWCLTPSKAESRGELTKDETSPFKDPLLDMDRSEYTVDLSGLAVHGLQLRLMSSRVP